MLQDCQTHIRIEWKSNQQTKLCLVELLLGQLPQELQPLDLLLDLDQAQDLLQDQVGNLTFS